MLKKIFNKVRDLTLASRRNTIVAAVVTLAVIVAVIFFIFSGNGGGEVVKVQRQDIKETVKIAGRVEADIVSDLGFPVSGTVRSVLVKEGDVVRAGQQLAILDLGILPAQLRSAEAEVKIKTVEASNTSINLKQIEQEQNTLVDNAYYNLLSEGLEAEPDRDSYTQTPPVITGLYDGPEGEYKIRISRRNDISIYFDIMTFGLERSGPTNISKTSATPLGTHGLFISLPDDLDDYNDTTWYVQVPNKKSTDYLANQNAFEEAKRTRSRALEEARAALRDGQAGYSIVSAQLEKARAAADEIRAQIGERILSAPFAGTVTAVSVDPGEAANSGEIAVSLISEGRLGVEIDLPEVDSIKVKVGDRADIVLDAFGDEVKIAGSVVSVNRSETIVDGVPVYEARLAFDADNDQIASGMTAESTIYTAEKKGVLAIPARAIRYRTNGTPYVVKTDTKGRSTKEAEVVLGLRGSDGSVEIRAGLAVGDEVLIAD